MTDANRISADRNVAAINELQAKKLAARDKLRQLRAEMKALDIEMLKVGATGKDLFVACW